MKKKANTHNKESLFLKVLDSTDSQIVQKEFKWEMAHRLVGFDGKKEVPYCDNCKNLHGHSYRAVVGVRLKYGLCLDSYGMVYDYNKMKIMKKWIDDTLDHCVIISSYDKSLLKFIKSQKGRDKHFVVNSPTTAENIAKLLYKKAEEILLADGMSSRVEIAYVTVNETSTSEARYSQL